MVVILRAVRLPADLHGRPPSSSIRTRRGSATPRPLGGRIRGPRRFNDKGWLDNAGKPATDQLHVTERFVRKDFGNIDIQITIDDPKAYTKPWTVTQPLAFQADTELLEYICNENNRYFDLVKDFDFGK